MILYSEALKNSVIESTKIVAPSNLNTSEVMYAQGRQRDIPIKYPPVDDNGLWESNVGDLPFTA